MNPKNTSARWFRAYAFLSKGQWAKAIEDYTKVIEQSSNDVPAYERRGYAYRNLGKYDQAIADLTKVIKRPKDPEAYRERGLTYRLMDNYAKSVADFSKVLELRPNDADAKSRLKYAQQQLEWQLPTPAPTKDQRKSAENAKGKALTATPSPAG